jgi:hypothetical protein
MLSVESLGREEKRSQLLAVKTTTFGGVDLRAPQMTSRQVVEN